MQTTRPSLTIQLLPEHIIDQIKAGEVIEKPSTLLKEILENALDAGATSIDLHIGNNGLDYIHLIDNGHGIEAEQLPLAFCRHATSKIERFEDIYRLHSYGFRGEALASIASISKVTCETQTKTESGQIKIEGGETISHQSEAYESQATGTKLFIKDLFYNTPVRMKFIQSKTSEKNQLNKIIDSFLLLNPSVNFSIKWDQGEKDFFPAVSLENPTQRYQEVLKKRGQLSFHENSNHYDGVQFQVYLSKESSRGNAHKSQFLFINDRYVQDIQLHKIILNSAAPLWPEGETGHYIAFINVPADEIDVNIHPNKTVVKLFKAPKVFSIVSSTIKQMAATLKPISAPSKDEVMSFSFNNNSYSKEIQYKSFNFNDESTSKQYFESLHQNQQIDLSNDLNHPQLRILKRYRQVSFIQIEKDLFLIKDKQLAKYHLKSILRDLNKDSEIVPLMISRPLEDSSNRAPKNLSYFSKLGFELDQIENKILLRSFPKEIQHYPYLKLLQDNLYISNEIKSILDLDLSSLDDYQYTQDYIFQIINQIGLMTLIESQILKKIQEKDLLSLYERK